MIYTMNGFMKYASKCSFQEEVINIRNPARIDKFTTEEEVDNGQV